MIIVCHLSSPNKALMSQLSWNLPVNVSVTTTSLRKIFFCRLNNKGGVNLRPFLKPVTRGSSTNHYIALTITSSHIRLYFGRTWGSRWPGRLPQWAPTRCKGWRQVGSRGHHVPPNLGSIDTNIVQLSWKTFIIDISFGVTWKLPWLRPVEPKNKLAWDFKVSCFQIFWQSTDEHFWLF